MKSGPIDRGLFHRRTRRGTAQPIVAGARQRFPCSMCNKMFDSDEAVRMHERDKHGGQLALIIEETAEQFTIEVILDEKTQVRVV